MQTDERLRQELIEEIERQPTVHATAIGVGVHNGIVTLSGQVDSYGKRQLLEKCAQRVRGMEGLVDEIVVAIPGAHERTDVEIAEAAITALAWHSGVPEDRVKVKVEGGWITLTGHVDMAFQKRAAEAAVRDLLGVRGVTNQIETRPGADAAAVKREIARTLHRRAEQDADCVRVEVHDGTATLKGTVRSWVEREDAVRAAMSTPGISRVENYIAVSA